MRKLAMIFSLITFFSTSGYAQNYSARIDSFLTICHEQDLFNGIVLVAKKDSLLLSKCYGYADRENKTPIDQSTRFRIGSLTKQFTTVMVFQLIEEGLLAFDDPISKYLPEYRRDIGEVVTIDLMLRQMSGIPSYTTEHFWNTAGLENHIPTELMKKYFTGNLIFEPGSTYRYSNTNTYLLGIIIERVTGLSYEENLEARLLKPLGMFNTGMIKQEQSSPEAKNYMRRLGRYFPEPYVDPSALYATGGAYSTAADLRLWMKAFDSSIVLSDTMIAKIMKPYYRINRFYGMAYGWNVHTIRPRNADSLVWLAEYNGQIHGAYAAITRMIEEDYLIILLSNHDKTPVTTEEIVNILKGIPFEIPRWPLRDPLGSILVKEGIDSVKTIYHNLQKKHEHFDRHSEIILNDLGYDLLRSDMINDAMEILEFNLAEHPKSPNAYDSYAEALLVKGDTTMAIQNYRKSLSMNPQNDNARTMLDILEK